jgi:hypothetical protein
LDGSRSKRRGRFTAAVVMVDEAWCGRAQEERGGGFYSRRGEVVTGHD